MGENDEDLLHRAKSLAWISRSPPGATAPKVGTATDATSRAEVWTPAALYGPRGLFDAAGRPLPITAALAALAGAAGQRVISAEIEAGLARLELERVVFTANLTPGRLAGLEAHGWMKEDRGPAAC